MGFEVKCVPVLDRMLCCCCSCDLKVGTCVLGWLGLIADVGFFLRGVICLAMFEETEEKLPQDSKEVLIATLVASAIGIILVSLLLYGAHNEKPGFMLPFVIINMIGIVIVAVAVLIIGIMLFFTIFLAGLLVLLIGGLHVALSSFFWMVIYSYYRKLEEQRYPFHAASNGNGVKE